MKSLGPNQKQLISSQWGMEQFIVAGTQGAEVPEAGGIEAMKLDAGASQCHPASGFQDSHSRSALRAVRETDSMPKRG